MIYYITVCSCQIGIIGGSGFYELEGLDATQSVEVKTEFGAPSDPVVVGKVAGVDCVVLARHGKGHRYNPTEVNYRANIRAMKKLGVTHILAATCCGSLREDLKPGELVVLDSFFDRTTKRAQSFHDQNSSALSDDLGRVCHIPMHPSFCPETRKVILESASSLGLKAHDGGTMVTIEGPRFSSRAESNAFRSWGCDLINMTTVPEVTKAFPTSKIKTDSCIVLLLRK